MKTRTLKPTDALEPLPVSIRLGRGKDGSAVFEVELADPHLSVHWPHPEPHIGRGPTLEEASQAAIRSLDDCPKSTPRMG